jgi:hypothetical protein
MLCLGLYSDNLALENIVVVNFKGVRTGLQTSENLLKKALAIKGSFVM